jgi:iron complex outermembrane receptor protein
MLLLLALLSAPAFAAEDYTLEAISVRGQKDNRTYAETTESVTTVDEAYLNQAGRENSIEVLNARPNVQINRGGESFSVRGINNTGVTGFQRDNLASILVDDVFQTDLAIAAGSFDVWDSERTELLLGPQSTTQGINSLAGNFLLYHTAPRFQPEGMAKLGIGSFGGRELGVALNRELSPGKLAGRLTYNKEWDGGFSRNVTTGSKEAGDRNKDKAGLTLTRRLGDGSELTVDGKFHRQREGAPYVQSEEAGRDELTENIPFDLRSTNYQLSARHRKDLESGWRNEAIVAFSSSKQNSRSDADNEAIDRLGIRVEEASDHFASGENLLKFENDRIKNTLGLHAHHYRLDDEYLVPLAFPFGGSSVRVNTEQRNHRSRFTAALFDSFLYRFNERHGVNLGARVEYLRNRFDVATSGTRMDDLGGSNGTVDNALRAQATTKGDANSNLILLPRAAYLLDLGPNHLGASYTRAYRTGGVSVNRRRGQASEYGPEFTDNFELSYKRPARDFIFSANAFYTNWSRQQVQVNLSATDTLDTQVVNAASSRLFGGEVQARRDFGRHAATLGAGYTRTRFNEFMSGSRNYAGNEFPFAPRYTVHLAYEVRPIVPLTVTTTLRLLGRSFTDAENIRRAPSQAQLDLNGQYTLGSWVFEGFANNVLNRRYRLADTSPTAPGYVGKIYRVNAPREFGLRVTYLW